jgi:hypothetical protein
MPVDTNSSRLEKAAPSDAAGKLLTIKVTAKDAAF